MTDAATRPLPIFAAEKTAARLLDMPTAEFRRLVAARVLPAPRRIDRIERWDVEELRRVINGQAADGLGEVTW